MVECRHETLGKYYFVVDVGPENETPELLFTENETNTQVCFSEFLRILNKKQLYC